MMMTAAMPPAVRAPKTATAAPPLALARALIIAALIIALMMTAACGDDLPSAPDFELTLFANADHQAGETLSMSDLSGRPVVLNFWFPSCPPCVAEMPHFEEAYQRFKSDGVAFVGVQLLGLDSAEDGQRFVERLGVSYALGADERDGVFGEIVKDYGVSGFPTTVFIDRNHRIRRTWTGALDADRLTEFIRETL